MVLNISWLNLMELANALPTAGAEQHKLQGSWVAQTSLAQETKPELINGSG